MCESVKRYAMEYGQEYADKTMLEGVKNRKRLRKHTYKEKEIPRNLTPRDFVCIAEGMDSMAEVFSILLHSVFFPASHLTDISCTRRESGY